MKKILGIIIVVLCLSFNIFVVAFLFGRSIPEIAHSILVEKHYDYYGFSLFVPQTFISQGSRVEANMLEAFFLNTPEDEYDPVLQINVYGNVSEGDIVSSNEYKMMSEREFSLSENANYNFKYHDGGIMFNQNNVKFYYDVVSLINSERIVTEKIVTFYHNNNQIQFFWTDDGVDFVSSVDLFDKVVDSIKTY